MGDDSQQKNTPPNDLDDDLAGDWESAFQADDFSFSPESGDDDFFLGDEDEYTSSSSSPYDFTPPTAKELEELPDLDESALEEEPAEEDEAEVTEEDATVAPQSPLTNLLPQLADFYHTTRLRLQLLSRKQQILAGAALVILLLIPLLIPDSDTEQPVSSHMTATRSTATGSSMQNEEPPVPEVTVKEKVRVKWKFPAFLIPAPPRKDTPRKTNFLQTDITLILLLEEGEEPPVEKELAVREIIFQFYSNQSLSELRRFALARGDMNRALRAWLEKQWPEAPVEAIVFNRYQVI